MAKRKIHWKPIGSRKNFCGSESLQFVYLIEKVSCFIALDTDLTGIEL